MDRPSARPLPEDHGLALIGDADRRDLDSRPAGPLERAPAGGERIAPDLLRVVLDPAGPRVVLPELVLAGRARPARAVEHHRPAAGRALIDRQDVARAGHLRLPGWPTRHHAASSSLIASGCPRQRRACARIESVGACPAGADRARSAAQVRFITAAQNASRAMNRSAVSLGLAASKTSACPGSSRSATARPTPCHGRRSRALPPWQSAGRS